MPTPQRPVAVLGVDSPIGLTVLRELGEHGIPVLALGRQEHALGRYSRHATMFERIERPLADWLPELVARRDPAAILAISEHDLIELARLKGRLGDCRVLCPDADTLDLVLDKQQTLDIAAGLGLSVPQGWVPQPGEDHAARAATLDYPVAIKWPDPNAVSADLAAAGLVLEKVEYAMDASALLAILARYDRVGRWPLVQTWCGGYGLGQMLHMHGGKATLRFQHRRLREWPPSGGVSTLCESIPLDRHAAQMALSEKLLQALGWEGPAMVEYRHDPATGRYWLMEVNGRFWGSIPLARHCGAQFAWEQVRCQLLGEEAGWTTVPARRKARYAIPDAKHFAAVMRDSKRPVAARLAFALRFLAQFLDPRIGWYVWSWRDPGPFFADLRAILRKAVRRGGARKDG